MIDTPNAAQHAAHMTLFMIWPPENWTREKEIRPRLRFRCAAGDPP
jgi:hypothetical protein